VESLQPVAELPELEELSLFGVLPESKSIEHLLLSKTLRRVRVSKYPPSEQQKVLEKYGA
ncbi:hypothetical protein KKC22_04090, partial [Myxococcota bacterium]|nr:hypothetical protein [Myxococcota bacterium]